jgi:hypothetical protein
MFVHIVHQVVYELDLKWWSLEGAYAGLVHEHGLSMTGDIATKQGVLRTSLTQIKRSFCDTNVLHDTVRHVHQCASVFISSHE